MKLPFGIVTVAALSLAVLLATQHRAETKLRDENQSLRAEVQELSTLEAENEQLSKQLALAKAARAPTGSLLSELLRLRGEVGMLSQETNHMAKLLQQNREFQASQTKARQTSSSHSTSAADSGQSDFPKSSWSFAGYATPDAAYQTVLWAQLSGDKENFLQSLTPEKRRQIEAMLEEARQKGISEQQLKAQNDSNFSSINGFQILGREMLAEDQIRLRVMIGGREIHPVLKKIANQWKLQNFD